MLQKIERTVHIVFTVVEHSEVVLDVQLLRELNNFNPASERIEKIDSLAYRPQYQKNSGGI